MGIGQESGGASQDWVNWATRAQTEWLMDTCSETFAMRISSVQAADPASESPMQSLVKARSNSGAVKRCKSASSMGGNEGATIN